MSSLLRLTHLFGAVSFIVLCVAFLSMPPLPSPTRSALLLTAIVLFFALRIIPMPFGKSRRGARVGEC